MSWLSSFLGTKKLRMPKVEPAQKISNPDEGGYAMDAYLRQLEDRSGFEDTLLTGKKKPKLAGPNYLGAN